MATMYFPLSTKQLANVQDADFWVKFIRRAKFPLDVTEFLFPILSHPVTGASLLVVSDEQYADLVPKLSAQDKTFLDNKLLPASDPEVAPILAAIAAAVPVIGNVA